MQGAAVNMGDHADDWDIYADYWLAENSDRRSVQGSAQLALINAYLRHESDSAAAFTLLRLAGVLEQLNQGRDALGALRLASDLDPSEAIAVALNDAQAKYGFRIVDQSVEADIAAPRICAEFSEKLDETVDYAPYVATPATGLAIVAAGNRLCIAGLEHGQRVELTFRRGLPSGTDEILLRDVPMTQYIRDRSPLVRFDGRNYVLPRMADAGLPVVTVNTDTLDLRLIRVSDRNLVQTLRDGYMARPLDYWSELYVTDRIGEVVWEGEADVGRELNAEITTRLPI